MVYRGIYSVWTSQVVLVVKQTNKQTNKKKPACQCRRHKKCWFYPWVRKIPWRRAWQPTAVFLPEESHGQKSLEGYGPLHCSEWDTTEATCTHKGIFCFNKICSCLPLIPYLPLAIQHTNSMILLSVQEDTYKLSTGDCF